jgi:hypothetical protein
MNKNDLTAEQRWEQCRLLSEDFLVQWLALTPWKEALVDVKGIDYSNRDEWRVTLTRWANEISGDFCTNRVSAVDRFTALSSQEREREDVQWGFKFAECVPDLNLFVWKNHHYRSPEWEAFDAARWLVGKSDWDGLRWQIAEDANAIIVKCHLWYCLQGEWETAYSRALELKRTLTKNAEIASVQRAVNVAAERHWSVRWLQSRGAIIPSTSSSSCG